MFTKPIRTRKVHLSTILLAADNLILKSVQKHFLFSLVQGYLLDGMSGGRGRLLWEWEGRCIGHTAVATEIEFDVCIRGGACSLSTL